MKQEYTPNNLGYVPPKYRPPETGGAPSARRIRRISDADLFKALRLDLPGLSAVARAVAGRKYTEAYGAWREYLAQQKPTPTAIEQEASGAEGGPGKKPPVYDSPNIVALKDQEVLGLDVSPAELVKRVRAWTMPDALCGDVTIAWLRALRLAHYETEDDRYVRYFDALFPLWLEQRERYKSDGKYPWARNPAWVELGVGARAYFWSLFYWQFRSSPGLSLATHRRLLKAILGNCRWLADYETKPDLRGGNWQVLACNHFLFAGRMFAEFKEAARWREIAVAAILRRSREDFLPDGCHCERFGGYYSRCVGRMAQMLDIADEIGLPAGTRRWIRSRLRTIYRFYMSISTPYGGMSAFGDAGYGDGSAFLEKGYRTTGDRELLWPIRDSEFARHHRPKKPSFLSAIKQPSGFAAMRSSWDRDAHHMSIIFGPYGSPHSHNDLFSFDIFAHGALLAADTSRFGSYGHPLDYTFRRAASHNMVVVEDCQLDRLNAKGEGVLWSAQKDADFFHASHRGYEERFGVIIERSVIFVRGEYWFMSDVVRQPEHRHNYTWYLHSPWRWKIGRDSAAQTQHRPGLMVVPARADQLARVRRGTTYDASDTGLPKGDMGAERHWFGYQKYSFLEDAVSYGTALIPYKDKPPAQMKVRSLPVSRNGAPVSHGVAEAFEVRIGRRRDVFIFNHRGHQARLCGDVETDARMAVVRFVRGKVAGASAIRVSRLAIDGRVRLDLRKRKAEHAFTV